jgi:hypothetical protein
MYLMLLSGQCAKRPADVSKLGTTNTDWQKQFIEKQILLTTIFL